jgi:hypothetical protein
VSTTETTLREFFSEYERRTNDALADPPREDLIGVAASFAAYFVESSPAGVMGGANDDAFKAMIPKGFAHYREVGGKAMVITALDVTQLDELHSIAHVDWRFDYVRPDGRSGHIPFTNHYFVTTADGSPKIFAYVTGDEAQAMKEHGLA